MPNPKSYHQVKEVYNALVKLIQEHLRYIEDYPLKDPHAYVVGQLTRMAQILDPSLSKLTPNQFSSLIQIASKQANAFLSIVEKDLYENRPLYDMEPSLESRTRNLAEKLTMRKENSRIEKILFSDKMPNFLKFFCHEVAKFCRSVLGKPTLADEIERGAAAIVKDHKKFMKDAKLAGKKVTTAKPPLRGTRPFIHYTENRYRH